MSFLDDILENDDTLALSSLETDKTLQSLVQEAMLTGNIDALRSVLDRGQVDERTPRELLTKIIGIAGSRHRSLHRDELGARLDFVQAWVQACASSDPVQRQAELDQLLHLCVSNILQVHDDVASRLVLMGANPLAIISTETAPASPGAPMGESAHPETSISTASPEALPADPPGALAIIGTAGRDKTQPLTRELWQQMLKDARSRVKSTDHLVSGGAAWADHLAVAMFLEGRVGQLSLHLPAPFDGQKFLGPHSSAASAANFYHANFRRATGVDGLGEIAQAKAKGAHITEQPSAPGYVAMFERNKIVANASSRVIAYTFGQGDEPDDGGTANTWKQIKGQRTHVPLGRLLHPENASNVIETIDTAKASQEPAAALCNTPSEISAARLGVTQHAVTTLARAIYSASPCTGLMLMAASSGPTGDQTAPARSIPTVARLQRGAAMVDVNALAYCVAIADNHQLERLLKACDLGDPTVHECMGDAITQIMELGLHEFGVDEVHHAIAKLLASGASGPVISRLASEFVTVCDSPSMKYRDENGVVMDGERCADETSLQQMSRLSLPACLLTHANPKVVISAMEALAARGWSPNAPAEGPQSRRGASVFQLACIRGDMGIIGALKSMGGTVQHQDRLERTAVDYAFMGCSRDAAFLLDPIKAAKLQADLVATASAKVAAGDKANDAAPHFDNEASNAGADASSSNGSSPTMGASAHGDDFVDVDRVNDEISFVCEEMRQEDLMASLPAPVANGAKGDGGSAGPGRGLKPAHLDKSTGSDANTKSTSLTGAASPFAALQRMQSASRSAGSTQGQAPSPLAQQRAQAAQHVVNGAETPLGAPRP